MSTESTNIPIHIGIIMDGNGRWATQKGLPRNAGHKKGADVFEKISRHALNIGVRHLTVFAFSTENFKRPPEEVDAILDLMRSYLKNQKKTKNTGVRVRFLGDISTLPMDIQNDVYTLEKDSQQFTELNLNIAFNYGGQSDILKAAKQLAINYKENVVANLDDISEKDFEKLLYTTDQPSVDLLIRTSGEQRISNFLLWQCAYAEFVFSPILWPDFSPKHFDAAIKEFSNRQRRLGGL